VKVLVTGATAPLGRRLIVDLLATPGIEQVLAVGLEASPSELPDDPRLAYEAVDLRRPRDAHDLIFGPARRLGIDCVIHTALHRTPRDDGAAVHATNVEGTRNLLLNCERSPHVRRFVFRSTADVYRVRAAEPDLIDEDHPIEDDPAIPQWVRDRIDADLLVCSRMAMSRLSVVVVRCAEILAPGVGSQLWDYLRSRVCLRPLGFDPMLNLLSIEDCVDALGLAARGQARGIYNIAGADTLPLSRVIALWNRREIARPGPLLAPLYHLRARTVGLEFRYDLNLRRFHFGGVLDGRRARDLLGYLPRYRIAWPATARHAA
jgi:UDP-glucose 4-epimerase